MGRFPKDFMLREGDEVGPYRVVRPIGRGGMGEVYEAEHVRLGVRHALKVFPLDGTNGAFLTKRFFAEGRLLARLDHPRIVRVHEMDETDRFAWFAMDLVVGSDGEPKTLADMPRAGSLPEATLVGWYEDMREALSVVHAAGIVHRDIKLENILVAKDGRAVLSDFGISRIVDERLRAEVAVTRTVASTDASAKTVLGTVTYLAPEVRVGGSPSAASDLYALGIAFFRLLTGLWYEPGPRAFDLLSPFDRRWRTILSALLDPDPEKRSIEPFRPPRCGRVRIWKTLLISSLVVCAGLAVFVAVKFARQPPADVSGDRSAENALEDEFSIPSSAQ